MVSEDSIAAEAERSGRIANVWGENPERESDEKHNNIVSAPACSGCYFKPRNEVLLRST